MIDRRLGPAAAAMSLLLLVAACGSDEEEGGDGNGGEAAEEQGIPEEEFFENCELQINPPQSGGLVAGVFYHPTEDLRLWEYDELDDSAEPVEMLPAGESFCGDGTSESQLETTDADGDEIILQPVGTPEVPEGYYLATEHTLQANPVQESEDDISADTDYVTRDDIEQAEEEFNEEEPEDGRE